MKPANGTDIPYNSTYKGVCEIHAWCPVEINKLPM